MVLEGKEDCFAYQEIRGKLVCSALRTNTCEGCKFYKPIDKIDDFKIENAIEKYAKRVNG